MARVARELRLSGVLASAITPHRTDSAEADFSGSLDLLDFLAGAGVAGIALLDAAGEFLDYSLDDRQRLVYLGVKRSRVPLLASVSHPTLSGAVHLADEAVSAGADGLLLMPPCFFRYGQAEIGEFCREFAAQTSDAVPLVLHNAPEWTSAMEIETVARLMRSGRFAGIVDSSGDWAYFERLLALKGEHGIAVLSGCDRMAVKALGAGADGLLSACACAIPELMVAIARGGDSGLESRLDEFLGWLGRFPVPAGIKRAVELRGQKSGDSFVPLADETQRALDEFSNWCKGWFPK
jgi:4-hydroxy-tetrahydrodipicolinate synthase